jgi:hypothetical protein
MNSNGNGQALAKREASPAESSGALMQLPDWMVRIRQAVTGAIKADDLEAILAKQVELAKQGDRKAAAFVLQQAKEFSEIKGVTLVQNIYHNSPPGQEKVQPGEESRPSANVTFRPSGRKPNW